MRAGVVTGIGVGIAFLAKGGVGPILLAATAIALPLAGRPWRTRSYARFLLVSLCTAAPWLLIWPAMLYRTSPALFGEWLWVNNLGRFMGSQQLGPSMYPLYYLTLLPWYAWPIAPLAAWTAWTESRDGWKTAGIQLPVVAAASMLLVLSVSHARRDVYVLPAFLPLALLAVRGLSRLPAAFLSAWRTVTRMGFGAALAILWMGWIVQVTGWPASYAQRILALQPGFSPELHPGLAGLALIVSVGWLWMMYQPADSGGRAVLQWTAGMTAVYGVALTLWLPMANYAMSYRTTVASLRAALPVDSGCLNSRSLGEPQRALFHYLGGVTTKRLEAGHPLTCDWLLIQGRYDVPGGFPQAPGPEWRPVWESRRGGREVFLLFRRTRGDGPEHTG